MDGQNLRVRILEETVKVFEERGLEAYRATAMENLSRWATEGQAPESKVEVIPKDWGEVASRFTRQTGRCYAVLNMANGHYPGGGYLEGCRAQEENMFRRTDCHFSLEPWQLSSSGTTYSRDFSQLVKGKEGKVFLDLEFPRVCIRGMEESSRDDLGYRWLAEEEIFPFYEMRSAAPELYSGGPFRAKEMRRRIISQLDTLVTAEVRHVVLGAFGCGAFGNPAIEVAKIYRQELIERWESFDHIVFAIFHPGYGPDNFTPFQEAFQGLKHLATHHQ